MAPFKWRQWRSPLAPMDVAIGANGDCDRHWRHSPNRHWRQWSIHWRHLLSPLAPMAPNDPFTKLSDTFTEVGNTDFLTHHKQIRSHRFSSQDPDYFPFEKNFATQQQIPVTYHDCLRKMSKKRCTEVNLLSVHIRNVRT